MIITICVALFLSLLALHVILRYSKARRIMSNIPGPSPLPFIGNLLMFNGLSGEKLWSLTLSLLDKYYPIFQLYGVAGNLVLLRHPDDVKILSSCKKNIEKAETVYGTIKSLDNDGLIVSGGEKWQQRRKMLNTAFNPHLLKVYVEIANEHAENFVKHVRHQSRELIPDLVELMNKFAMEVICEAVMGSNSHDFESAEAEEFRHSFHDVSNIAFYRAIRPYIQDWMMKFLPIGRRTQRAVNNVCEFAGKVIQERREYHKKIGYQYFQNKVDDDVFTSQKKRLAILDLLLIAEMDDLIDQKGIRDEIETIILAGYETTGVSLAFTLMLLAENAEAQGRARAEATEIINRTGGILTMADLTELYYLDRCIKETMRLFPGSPFFGRHIQHELKLSKYTVPPGNDVGMYVFALHRDPNFWHDPAKFDPNRFLPENVKKRHPFAYMPFSAGPRSCIGFKLAILEMKALVSRILYNFYLEPVDLTTNVKFDLNITLKPLRPCRIKLIKINHK